MTHAGWYAKGQPLLNSAFIVVSWFFILVGIATIATMAYLVYRWWPSTLH